MTNHMPPVLCEETISLLQRFFEQTDANEVSETLSALLDTHIQHGKFERLDLANTVNMVGKLQQLLFNLQQRQPKHTQERKQQLELNN